MQQQIVQAPSSSHERNHDPSGGSISRFGSADVAKHRVRAYFQSLRDQLNVQEVAALTVVDTYIRERLCSMRQQEEDCEVILSQVSNAEKFLLLFDLSAFIYSSFSCKSNFDQNNKTITLKIGSNCLCQL